MLINSNATLIKRIQKEVKKIKVSFDNVILFNGGRIKLFVSWIKISPITIFIALWHFPANDGSSLVIILWLIVDWLVPFIPLLFWVEIFVETDAFLLAVHFMSVFNSIIDFCQIIIVQFLLSHIQNSIRQIPFGV